MSRTFKTVDYEATLNQTVRLGDCLPPDHLARFIVDVVAQLDFAPIYARYAARGGTPYAPELLFGLLVYGYATGVFSSRKIERATYESAPFRFIAGNLHPDHDTLATFRKTFLPDLQDLFVQVLLLAQEMGVLKLGTISIDGTQIHADASKSKAVSYKRLLELEAQLRAEVAALFALGAQADQGSLPDGLVVTDEIARREERLKRLAEAKAVLEARAKEREAQEQAEYAVKLREREDKAKRSGKKPRSRPLSPPTPGPRDADQYNFTAPDSRIMQNADKAFVQAYNGQAAVDAGGHQIIVGCLLSNQSADTPHLAPMVAQVQATTGRMPAEWSADAGCFSADNVATIEQAGGTAYLPPDRQAHAAQPLPAPVAQILAVAGLGPALADEPLTDNEVKAAMRARLRTAAGRAAYGQRKERRGLRRFLLRGLAKVRGEWTLWCLTHNLRKIVQAVRSSAEVRQRLVAT